MTLTLLDLNPDCLEKLCDYLNVEDIVTFSHVSKSIKNIVSDFFKKKIKYQCNVNNIQNDLYRIKRTVAHIGNHLKVINLYWFIECNNEWNRNNEKF